VYRILTAVGTLVKCGCSNLGFRGRIKVGDSIRVKVRIMVMTIVRISAVSISVKASASKSAF